LLHETLLNVFVSTVACWECSLDTDPQVKMEHFRWYINKINLFTCFTVEGSEDTSVFYTWTCGHPWRPAYSWRFSSCLQWLFKRSGWSQDRCA